MKVFALQHTFSPASIFMSLSITLIFSFAFQALAQIWGCSFVEASAKHRTNVNEVFAEIVREMNLKHSAKDREIVCECCVLS